MEQAIRQNNGEQVMHNLKGLGSAKGESFFKVQVNFFVDESFREDKLRRFVLEHSRIRRCTKVSSSYNYCIVVHLRYQRDFEEFHQDLLRSVPGIGHANIGIIKDILKR